MFLKVFRASAGSGKTYTLAAEYIAKLLKHDVDLHREILAMTFTNKATTEMKERIMMRLFDISVHRGGDFTEKVLRLIGNIDEPVLAKRAGDALWAIVHDYDHFQVQTIDSFFQRMLTGLAHELGLSANYRVDINDTEAVTEAVDRMLSNLFTEENSKLLKWIRDYISTNLEDGNNWKISDKIRGFALNNVLTDSFQNYKDEYMDFLEDETRVGSFQASVRRQLSRTVDGGDIYEAVTGKAAELMHRLEEMNSNNEFDSGKYTLGYLRNASSGVFKAICKTVGAFLSFPETFVREKFRDDISLRDAACDFIDSLKGLLDDISALEYVQNSALFTLQTFNNLRLLGAISQNVDIVNAEHHRFLLPRTKWLFSRMVSSSDSPFIFEKIGTRLHHIMIDEFQDTARTQWNNIRKLLLENVSRGDSCLIVGDVKQSIYRFNGGDWSILANLEREVGVPIDSAPLKTNFRSKKRIVVFNNLFFLYAAKRMDGQFRTNVFQDIYNAEDTRQSWHDRENAGYVRACVCSGKEISALSEELDTPEEDFSLYAAIKKLHAKGIEYRDMAILVRWNSEAESVVNHFASVHPEIPLVSNEAFLLSSSPCVVVMVSALRWLANRADTASLVYCADVYQNKVHRRNLNIGIIAADVEKYVPAQLLENRESLLATPLYECILMISGYFGFDSNLSEESLPGQGLFISSFYDNILTFLKDSDGRINTFLKYWDENLVDKKIPSAEVNGITVVTVHKSKGLAYDTVLLPFCDWQLDKSRNQSNSYIWAKGADAPYNMLPPYPLSEKKEIANSTYSSDYEMELFQRRVDSVNMLYVAFTRAKSNLLFWSSDIPKTNSSDAGMHIGNLAGSVLSQIRDAEQEEISTTEQSFDKSEYVVDMHKDYSMYSFGEPYVDKKSDTESGAEIVSKDENPFEYNAEPLVLNMHTDRGHFDFLQSSEASRFICPDDVDDAREEYIKRGNALHWIYSQIRYRGDINIALQRAKHEGIVDADDIGEVQKFIEESMNNEYAKQWFSGEWTIYNECEIIAPAATAYAPPEVHRPDRVMKNKDEVIVVDYKFGTPKIEHRNQVGRYMELLTSMGHTNVRGYIWYLYSNKVVKV